MVNRDDLPFGPSLESDGGPCAPYRMERLSVDDVKKNPRLEEQRNPVPNAAGKYGRLENAEITAKEPHSQSLHAEGGRISNSRESRNNSSRPTIDTTDSLMNTIEKKSTFAFVDFDRANAANDDHQDPGVAFEELVDRLLSPAKSKRDSKFRTTFLCLYRKFAPPSDLLMAIMERFEEAENGCDLLHLTAQLRYLGVMLDWISDYPGDFAHHTTRHAIVSFVQSLGSRPEFAVAHKEISPYLESFHDDDDTEWACSDHQRSRASTMESLFSASSLQGSASTVTADSSTEDVASPLNSDNACFSAHTSTRSSAESAPKRSASQATRLSLMTFETVEDARRQALLLHPNPRCSLDKPRWRELLDVSEEAIALELTRIDWILYSSIRPRDLIRHISLNVELKERCKSLEYVNRMISEFNHVAFWVANMVLLRDKAKDRAIMLEKFMSVAWQLRYLNNYNSLGAVIAGINGTAVHRLSRTRALVSDKARTQFMRLEILMGTAKSHSAYRLGWQNTSTPRIPFLPLHRRDLVFAEEGNRTFIRTDEDERINWKKFEIMGEVIMEIQKSQELPYPSIKRNEQVFNLLLESKYSKDEDVRKNSKVIVDASPINANDHGIGIIRAQHSSGGASCYRASQEEAWLVPTMTVLTNATN